jgi:pimeloyl-ACP methyl ester carboxylesterase
MDTYRRGALTFDVRDHGPADGAAVVCLHGFPQDGTAFDRVVPLLVAGGLRVLVPDQRGYSPGARPTARTAYRVDELVDDVVALLDAAGVARAHVVGHDWGGVVAWGLGSRRPERTASLTVLSTPHPTATARSVTHSSQALRSSYMAFFQIPRLPERLLLADDAARLRRGLLRSGLAPQRVDHYARRMQEPGALTGALAWYRAIPTNRGAAAGAVPVSVPTTLVHGRHDPFITEAAIRGTGHHVRGPLRQVRLESGHWLPEQEPDRVAGAVLATVRQAAPHRD